MLTLLHFCPPLSYGAMALLVETYNEAIVKYRAHHKVGRRGSRLARIIGSSSPSADLITTLSFSTLGHRSSHARQHRAHSSHYEHGIIARFLQQFRPIGLSVLPFPLTPASCLPQVYNRSITDPSRLNRYKGWSEEVSCGALHVKVSRSRRCAKKNSR